MKYVISILVLGFLVSAQGAMAASAKSDENAQFEAYQAKYRAAGPQNSDEIFAVIGERTTYDCHVEIDHNLPLWAINFNILKGYSFDKTKHLGKNQLYTIYPYELVVKDEHNKIFSVSLYQDSEKSWNKIDYIRVVNSGDTHEMYIETAIEFFKAITGGKIELTPSIEAAGRFVYSYTICDLNSAVETPIYKRK